MISIEDINAELAKFEDLDLDIIGNWTVIKEKILAYYFSPYTNIIGSQKDTRTNEAQFRKIYIDGFAGAGIHVNRSNGELVPGSALNAANTLPEFDELLLVDNDPRKTQFLKSVFRNDKRVSVECDDSNSVLPDKIFPQFPWKSFSRIVCFLDPYKLSVDWSTIMAAGATGKDNNGKGSVDLFINYPNHDIIRNITRSSIGKVSKGDIQRMSRFWGDSSWQGTIYTDQPKQEDLFIKKHSDAVREGNSKTLAIEFKKRLKEIAGFEHVVDPFHLVNSVGNSIFLLFFASHNPTAAKIVREAFSKFRNDV